MGVCLLHTPRARYAKPAERGVGHLVYTALPASAAVDQRFRVYDCGPAGVLLASAEEAMAYRSGEDRALVRGA